VSKKSALAESSLDKETDTLYSGSLRASKIESEARKGSLGDLKDEIEKAENNLRKMATNKSIKDKHSGDGHHHHSEVKEEEPVRRVTEVREED
jgi:hypothetical protein